jgi:hypothetical protein
MAPTGTDLEQNRITLEAQVTASSQRYREAVNLPPEERPVNAYKELGNSRSIGNWAGSPEELRERVSKYEQEYSQAAYRQGYEEQKFRFSSRPASTLQEVETRIGEAQRMASTYVETATLSSPLVADKREDFVAGLNKAIEHYAWETKPRFEVAETFSGVSFTPEYGKAETLISQNIARQIREGATTINLSQAYATNDQALASRRHERALEILAPAIEEARKAGFNFEAGNAIAVQQKVQEVIAIRQGTFGQGLSLG